MPIKAVLGDQESGVSGGWRGVKKTSLQLSEWGRSAVSECATFSGFGLSDNENLSENRKYFDETESSEVADAYPSTSSIDQGLVSLKGMNAS